MGKNIHKQIKKMPVYVAIDVEAYPNPSTWQAFGAVAITMPECRVLYHINVYCDRSDIPVYEHDANNVAFWQKHATAFMNNRTRGMGRSASDAEHDIVNFIDTLKLNCPHFYLVADCPAFDLRIVNNILDRHGRTPLSNRGGGVFHQPICTWSTRLTLQTMIGVNSLDLKVLCASSSSTTDNNNTNQIALLAKHAGLPHTPLSDAFRILHRYLSIIEFMQKCRIVVPQKEEEAGAEEEEEEEENKE